MNVLTPLADEREPAGLVDRSAQQPETDALEPAQESRAFADRSSSERPTNSSAAKSPVRRPLPVREAESRLAHPDRISLEQKAQAVAVEARQPDRAGEGHLGEPHSRNFSSERAIPAASSPWAVRCSGPSP